MSGASNARIKDEACEVTSDYSLYITLAAANNLDVVTLEFAQCTIAHIAGEHNLDAHLLKVGGNARLTSATLRRCECLGTDNLLILNSIDGVMVAMTKVVVYMTIACRKCNLCAHNINFLVVQN